MSIQSVGPKLDLSGLRSNQDSNGGGDTTALSATPLPTSIDLTRKEDYQLSISEKAVVDAVEKANKALAGIQSHVEYSVHKPHGDIVVRIINSETKELIREIPPEKILNLLDKMEELNGQIIDEKR